MTSGRQLNSERRAALIVLVAALAALAALGAWTRLTPAAGWEVDFVTVLALGDDAWAAAVRHINNLGNLPLWAGLVAVLALVIGASRGRLAALAVGLTLGADVVAAGLKAIIERGRPETDAVAQLLLSDNFAFPSGHVVRAVALAAVVAWIVAPRRKLASGVVAALAAGLVMGYARVALGVHWPTDALGGFLLGTAWFALTALLLPAEPARGDAEAGDHPDAEHGHVDP